MEVDALAMEGVLRQWAWTICGPACNLAPLPGDLRVVSPAPPAT